MAAEYHTGCYIYQLRTGKRGYRSHRMTTPVLFPSGGADVAEEFRSQEIDGQALLLLTEDHLVSTMNLKLGPALKLCAHINSLKDA